MASGGACPFLIPVVADRLWMYPVAAYCCRSDRIRVPAPATITAVCADGAHTSCPSFREARGDEKA